MDCPVTKIKGGTIIGFFEEPKQEEKAPEKKGRKKAVKPEAEEAEAEVE